MKNGDKSELIDYRIRRAEETLNEVKVLIENQLWNIAVNRIYYSCFYGVTALLLKNNIKTKTHSGVRQMFGLHFVKNNVIPIELGKFYSDIFEMRHSGDYDDFIEFTMEEVSDSLETAWKLVTVIKSIL